MTIVNKILINIILAIIFLSGSLFVNAQEITLTASAKNRVAVGEQFPVTFKVNANGSGFKGPDFEGFRVLTGPNSSTSQSYQIINGNVAQSYEVTYTYYLQAQKEGEYSIQPASVTVNGKTYKSDIFKIQVVAASKTQTPAGGNRQSPTSQDALDDDDVFIKALVNKTQAYQGEQVIITYKIYTKIPISQISINKLSSFPGFWYKDLLENDQQLRQSNEVINGEQYVVADLRKIALFPQRNGDLNIDPMELECVAQVRTQAQGRDPFFDSFFDDPFFNRNIKNIQLVLTSNPVVIKVKPLPSDKKPNDFKGAVGSFTMSTSIDRTELKANEAISMKITISGKGNIELIDELDFQFPPDFEVYDPKISNKVNKSSSGISGTRVFEYLIIPRNAGKFVIPANSFSYFDPGTKTYKQLTTPEYKIQVEKGEEQPGGISYSGVSQKDIQFIGSDIRHIRNYPFKIARINSFFYRSTVYYLLIIISVVLVIIIILLNQFLSKRRSNVNLMKNRRATKVAKLKLKKAHQHLKANQVEDFYIEISKALWGYLSDKFNIPLSELSMDTVNNKLESREVSQQTVDEFIEVLNNCEYARFAPGDSSQKMNEIYSDGLGIISKIEAELK